MKTALLALLLLAGPLTQAAPGGRVRFADGPRRGTGLCRGQDDPVAQAMEKIRKAIGETRSINLARTVELLKVIRNEGTFLESQKKAKEQAALYAQAADALARALEAQEARTGPLRKAVLTLQKASRRAEKKKTDEARVGAWRYAFDRIALAFQVESAELRALVSLGLDCFREGEFEEAEEALKEAEERLPAILGRDLETTDKNARFASMILAQTYLATGRYAEAGAAARRGVRLVPDLADEEIHLRDLHKNAEDYDSYLRKLDEHVAKNPADLDARFLLGFQIYFSPGRAKAKAVFEGLRERNKDDEGAAYFLEKMK
ncbi:MAG: hypothetical protein HYY17_06645 [Planctomycetes bacterium]|nr:hypothetical protein [Planctomycetota bacterium]